MLEYTYRKIKNDYEKYMKKLEENSGISEFEVKLCTTFGYALDMIDLSRAMKKYLNLTIQTNNNFGEIIMYMYQIDIKKGLSLKETKEDLIKKISSYQLLTHYNFFNSEVQLKTELYEEENNLGLMINNIKVDIYKIVQDCVNKDFVFGKEVGIIVEDEESKENEVDEAIIINLQRLYNAFRDVLIQVQDKLEN